MDTILRVENLKKYYPTAGGAVKAVDGVSFSVARGTTMALVGESGCGKSTTGRMVLRLGGEKQGGTVCFDGTDIYGLSPKALRHLRPRMQMIFQDPFSSLSPRLPVGTLVSEAVRAHKLVPKEDLADYTAQILTQCGLPAGCQNRYPHEFSGGQRQRICIARALAMSPEFIVCDEAVSALDVSVQAQIINLLRDLQERRGLAYLFISHDLSVVAHMAHTVGVMYLGSMMEYAPTDRLFSQPLHPYTQALLAAIPVPDPRRRRSVTLLEGAVPSPADPPDGCKFHTRCPHAMAVCAQQPPQWVEAEPGHFCACHLVNGS